MRRVQIGDILALAHAVAGRPDGRAQALRLCDEAHAAHAFCKRQGRLHPLWGNGSLMSRVHAAGGTMQADWGAQGLAALAVAAEAILLWRAAGLDCRAPRLYAKRDGQPKE